MKKVSYFLFGSEAVTEFTEGMEALKALHDDGEQYATFKFTEGETSPIDFISEFNGWSDYAVLTKDEYNTIENL